MIAGGQLDLRGEKLNLTQLQERLTKEHGWSSKLFVGRPSMLTAHLQGSTVQIYPGGKLTIFRCTSNTQLIAAMLRINSIICKLNFDSIHIQTCTHMAELDLPPGGFSILKQKIGLYDAFRVSYNPELFPQALSIRSIQLPRLFANMFYSKKLVLMGSRSELELTLILSLITDFFKLAFPNHI